MKTNETHTILQALVGSRAHGLHTESSDYDWRGIHVIPTSKILSLGYKHSPTQWIEGDQDETSYEIGHFLQLATKANPSVLEVLMSDQVRMTSPYATMLRDSFPYMYDPKDAYNAFAGYSCNQRKKLLEDHLGRKFKFGVAYIRTAYNLTELFKKGRFSLRVEDNYVRNVLLEVRAGAFSDGQIIDKAESYIKEAKELLPSVKNRQNLDLVNNLLLRIRKDFWEAPPNSNPLP